MVQQLYGAYGPGYWTGFTNSNINDEIPSLLQQCPLWIWSSFLQVLVLYMYS